MSETSCWYSLKNVGNCSNGGALLYLTEIKYYLSTLKPLIVTFNYYQGCLYIFLKFG